MKDYTCQVAKIVGTPDAHFWSQVHAFFPEEAEKSQKRGIFLGVFAFSGSGEGIEAISFGREILSRLHEEYYGELETPAMEKLTQAVSKVALEFSQPGQNLEIVAGVVLGKILYLAVLGEGQVWVKRGENLQKVLEGTKERVETASGFLQEGDFLVLGTDLFFTLLPEGTLRTALENATPDGAVEILAPLVSGKEGGAAVAALICETGEIQEIKGVEEEESLPLVTSKKERRWAFKLPHFRLGLRLGEIYLRSKSQESKRKKTIFTVALILIFLLGISIVFGKGKKELQDKENKFNQLSGEIERFLEEGKALARLNPNQARELILKAKALLPEIESLKIENAKTENLKKETEAALSLVIKEHQLGEVPTFLELGLFREKGRGDKLALYGHFLTVLDTKGNLLYGIDILRKSGDILAGGENLAGSKFVTSDKDSIFTLGEKGVIRTGIKSKKTEVKIPPLENWEKLQAMKVFAANLYLIDQTEIWRYQGTEESFSSRQKWLGEGTKADFSQVVSLAIDGSIWLLRQDGKILKFIQGAPQAFGVAGLDKPLSGATVIYTDAETQNLYLLDKGNARVVVFTKGGEYRNQYLWPGLAQVSDMVVSEEAKKVFLLAEGKILSFELQ